MNVLLANIFAIYRRELQSYFAAPWAYVIAAIFWAIGAFLFTIITFSENGIIVQGQIYDMQVQAGGQLPPIDLAYELIRTFLSTLGFITLFVLPILSMGLYTEERKRGTLELLATSPITNWAVAVGKLLAVVTFFATLILPLMVYQAIVLSAANPPIQPLVFLWPHLGLLLLGAAVLSLGMFISSLTDSTIVAAIATFGLLVVLWLMDTIADRLPGVLGTGLAHLSLLKHYTNLVLGIVDTSSLMVFGSYIFLGIFLTAQSIEAFRFQRS